MRGLMILVTNKMELDIAQILTSDVLFAHFIDETLAFHRELHFVYSYPASLHSCLHILIQPEPFHRWKTIEKKCEQNKLKLCSYTLLFYAYRSLFLYIDVCVCVLGL